MDIAGPYLRSIPFVPIVATANGMNVTSLVDQPVPVLTPAERDKPAMWSYDAIKRVNFAFPGYNYDPLIVSKGYRQLDEMLTMAAYASALRRKKTAILQKPWRVTAKAIAKDKPAYKTLSLEQQQQLAGEIADYVEWVFYNIQDPLTGEIQDLRTVLWYILDACHIGFSLQEIGWRYVYGGQYHGKQAFSGFSYKIPEQIGFVLDAHTLAVRAITEYTPIAGYNFAIPLEKCLLYTYNPWHALPYGWGDARACYKHVMTLNNIYAKWNVALERFGMRIPVFKSPTGDQDEMNRMTQVGDAIRDGATVVMPETWPVEWLEAIGSSFDHWKSAAEYHQGMIVQHILGQTLTTQEGTGKGTWALGNVHGQTEESILSFHRQDVESLIETKLIRQIVENNCWGPEMIPGRELRALAPDFSLGIWNAGEMQSIVETNARAIETGQLDPSSPYVSESTGYPPNLTANMPIPILPGRERVDVTAGVSGSNVGPAPAGAASG